MNISLSASAPENLVSRDGFGSPVPRQPALFHVCVWVCVVIPFIPDVRLVDVPAGVTQEEGHTGFQHLPSAVLALIFIARWIQPFLSLVDREDEFCVLTNQSFSTCWAFFCFLFLYFCSCDCTGIRTHVSTSKSFEVTNLTTGATCCLLLSNLMLTYGIPPEFCGGVHYSVPSLSGHLIAYRWRSLARVPPHWASKPQM